MGLLTLRCPPTPRPPATRFPAPAPCPLASPTLAALPPPPLPATSAPEMLGPTLGWHLVDLYPNGEPASVYPLESRALHLARASLKGFTWTSRDQARGPVSWEDARHSSVTQQLSKT